MQLTFREVENAFEVEEKILYQWLNARGMPAVKANDQYYFNSVEVLEWALKNKIPLTAGALKLCEKQRSAQGSVAKVRNFGRQEEFLDGKSFNVPSKIRITQQTPPDIFTPALMRGGVYFGIAGSHREDVLGKALDLLPLPAHIQRASLKAMLLSREQAGTTGIGNGIAIPHVKHPVILAGLEPVVGLFFLENQIDFAAFDGEGVHTLFVILSGSFKGHLSLLSRLAFCLQDENVKAALSRRMVREEILAAFQVAESKTAKVS